MFNFQNFKCMLCESKSLEVHIFLVCGEAEGKMLHNSYFFTYKISKTLRGQKFLVYMCVCLCVLPYIYMVVYERSTTEFRIKKEG